MSDLAEGRMSRPRVKRDPICPRCRQRHTYGQAVAYHDSTLNIYRCGRCNERLDSDGECPTPNCCGWSAPRLMPRRLEHTTSTATTKYTLNFVGRIK